MSAPVADDAVSDREDRDGDASRDDRRGHEASDSDASDQPSPPLARRTRRRARTEPPRGSDPTPTAEPTRHSESENSERLRREKPPHY